MGGDVRGTKRMGQVGAACVLSCLHTRKLQPYGGARQCCFPGYCTVGGDLRVHKRVGRVPGTYRYTGYVGVRYRYMEKGCTQVQVQGCVGYATWGRYCRGTKERCMACSVCHAERPWRVAWHQAVGGTQRLSGAVIPACSVVSVLHHMYLRMQKAEPAARVALHVWGYVPCTRHAALCST